MSRINTNVSALIAQRILRKNQNALNTSLERLSTGYKINRGADNPAGLIASENLRSEKAGLSQAIDNAERASNIIGTAEGGLSEVSSLLTEVQSLVSETANAGGLSSEEVAANQLQVDSILNTINRIAGSTAFQGVKLLNGSLDYTTSGVNSTQFDNVRVNAARLPDGQSVNVAVQVITSAQTGQINYTGGTITGNTVTIEVGGNGGTESLSFASGTTISSIVTSINAVKEATGVSATVSGTAFKAVSTSFGSSQFVSIKTIAGTFAPSTTKDFGRDAGVNINGSTAETDGLNISYRAGNLDIEFDLDSTFNKAGTATFSVTGGGATFALGAKVSESDKAAIGISSVSSSSLGNSTIGFLSSLSSGGANAMDSGNLASAQKVIDKAIKQVSQLRGRLGAFQKFTIGATINSLGVALENSAAAESAIRDTDFAEETSALTRSQILSQASTTVLAQANSSPSLALSLLQG